MSSASRSVPFETLNKNNYNTWKMQMQALLVKNNTWAYVNGECPKPDLLDGSAKSEKAVQAWIKNDEKAKSDLILSISSTELNQIEGCSTSREMWQKLEHIYQPKEMVVDICEPPRKVTLLKELLHQKMAKNGDVKEHIQKFSDIVKKLADMEVKEDDYLAVMLLYSLPSTFGDFQYVIESQDELPSPEVLCTKIIEEDARKTISKARRSTQKKTPQSEVRERKNNPVSAVTDTKKSGTGKGNAGLKKQMENITQMLQKTNLH